MKSTKYHTIDPEDLLHYLIPIETCLNHYSKYNRFATQCSHVNLHIDVGSNCSA